MLKYNLIFYTMKTLYIIRHAKASWEYWNLDDYDRNLSDRWKSDIKLIWEELKKREIKIDKIYCSSAKRTTKTCKKLCKEINYDFEKVKFDKNLYTFSSKSLDFFISYIMDFDNDFKNVALIWHNNILSEFASYLTWQDIVLPTSWTVKIDFPVKKWKDVSYGSWKLNYFIYPKMFKIWKKMN